MKQYVVGTHQKHLSEALLMSTHNMFLWRNKKNINNFLIEKKSASSGAVLSQSDLTLCSKHFTHSIQDAGTD